MTTFLTIVQMICAISIIASVAMQSSKSSGLSGSIAGGAETFFGKKKGIDAILARITGISAAAFLTLSLIIAII